MAGRVVILGAGPTGLGAAHRLAELGHDYWDVYEASDHVGGLAATVTDPYGFRWDHGGHVMFSHYPYVDDLVAWVLGGDVERKVRRAQQSVLDELPRPSRCLLPCHLLSNHSSAMTPGPGHFSLLAEVSVSTHRPFDPATAADRTLDGLVQTGLLTTMQREHDVVSTNVVTVPYSYPVPTLARDAALDVVHGWLVPLGIRSRGRFGAWRYEVGNTDHSIMMGVESADRLLTGAPERTWTPPRP